MEQSLTNLYDGYKWIKAKKHVYDSEKSWEENYQDLKNHHIEETSFLIEELRKLAENIAASK